MSHTTRAMAAKIIRDLIINHVSFTKSLPSIQSIKTHRIDLIQALAYGVARYYFQLDYIARQLLKKHAHIDPIVYALILIGLYQLIYSNKPAYAIVNETVKATGILHKIRAKSLINGVLRNFLRKKEQLLLSCTDSLSAKWSHPTWMIEKIKKDWPLSWETILFENNQHPPLSLRVNLNVITRKDYLDKLLDSDIKAQIHPLIPSGLILKNPVPISKLPEFKEGKVSIQDVGAQWAPILLDLKNGQSVLDACAAPGGKTTHMLEVEPNLGKLVAIDFNPKRLEKISDNLKRLRISFPVKLIAMDVRLISSWWDKEPFDRILLDAPCSASGVIRRHPDIKLLRQSKDITQFQTEQLTYLEALWTLLKSGGKLLYVTCSIFRAENEEVIDQFLMRHLLDAKEIPIVLHGLNTLVTQHGKQILTGQQQMDGFYYALLQKVG